MRNIDLVISARIMLLVAGGMYLPTAFDAVLGAGAWDKMAGELYDELRAKG
jgi:hypothetical protein